MRIWHLEAEPQPDTVNGASNSAWQIALGQAQGGHEVTLFLDKPPVEASLQRARVGRLQLAYLPGWAWNWGRRGLRYAATAGRPDIVHMHSVFIPRHAALARSLVRSGIPYVLKPAGGLNRHVLNRGWIKKRLYIALVERRRLLGAAAIVTLTLQEQQEVREIVPGYQGLIRCVPNPIDFGTLDGCRWTGQMEGNRLVFMGRFDVYHKGLDILAEIARQAPEVQFDLYGESHTSAARDLDELILEAPTNMHFHPPLRGRQKAEAMQQADGLILTSRWEGFGRVVADAMGMGLPCFISETLAMADLFRDQDLGIVMSADPARAVADLREALANRQRLLGCSRRAMRFAVAEFSPAAVTQKYIELYEDVLNARQPVAMGEVDRHD